MLKSIILFCFVILYLPGSESGSESRRWNWGRNAAVINLREGKKSNQKHKGKSWWIKNCREIMIQKEKWV